MYVTEYSRPSPGELHVRDSKETLQANIVAIFTDLDGTLLQAVNPDWTDVPRAYYEALGEGALVIPVTSKSGREVEVLHRQWGALDQPRVIENGAAYIITKSVIPVFPTEIVDNSRVIEKRDRWHVKNAVDIEQVREVLDSATSLLGISIERFGNMTPERFSQLAEIPVEKAELALRRKYQEGFIFTGSPPEKQVREYAKALRRQLARDGFSLTKGNRFWQVTGHSDKGRATAEVQAILAYQHGPVHSVGIGDSWRSDLRFLRECTDSYYIRHSQDDELPEDFPNNVKIVDGNGLDTWGDIYYTARNNFPSTFTRLT